MVSSSLLLVNLQVHLSWPDNRREICVQSEGSERSWAQPVLPGVRARRGEGCNWWVRPLSTLETNERITKLLLLVIKPLGAVLRKNMEVFLKFIMMLSSLLYVISICTPILLPPWFLCHPVTLFRTVMCPPSYLPFQPKPPPSSPCTAWGRVRVRTCRLPLIWVGVIQFSGCYKPAQYPTTPFTFSLMFHGHKMCLQPPLCGAKGTRTHMPLVPHRYP